MDAWAVKAGDAYDASDYCPACGTPLRVEFASDGDGYWPDEIECPECGATFYVVVEIVPDFWFVAKEREVDG